VNVTFMEKGKMFRRTFSVVMTLLLLFSVIVLAFDVRPAKAGAQTVYINADGSITPAGAPISSLDKVTYTLTGNISYPTYNGIAVERNNITLDGKGYAIQGNQSPFSNGLLLNGTRNVTFKGGNIKNFAVGIYLASCSQSSISGNNVTENNNNGIELFDSSNSTINGNNVTSQQLGIWLYSSSNNTISGNSVENSSLPAIELASSSNHNNVRGNNVTNSGTGVELSSSNYNSVSGNGMTYDSTGIYVESSSGNIISGNNMTNDGSGIWPYSSDTNMIYHNDFVHNTVQVFSNYNSTNAWDNGYPSGGNYWSDYTGTDLFSGLYQNVTGSDGIGDTPYIIDSNNKDRYPLMQPWTGPAQTSTYITLSVSLIPVGSAVTCNATVSGPNAGTRATGTVTWSTSSTTGNFSTPVCALSSGSCSTKYVDSCPGSATIAAYYSGDSNYQASSGTSTLTVVSSGPVYYSENYSSVQAAINASTPGSNLIVAAGNYQGSLILNKPLTIVGVSDPPVFGGGGSGIFLTVLSGASGSNITGFEITDYDEGILVYASNCRIYGNAMSSISEDGIVLEGSSAIGDIVYDNVFQDTPTAISLTTSTGANTIYDNIINSQASVTVSIGANDNSVYQNVISGSSIVLNMTSSTGNTIYQNDFLATVQIVAAGSNTWDNGSSSEGNYWSDYVTKYPNAVEIDSSGVWNTPYIINSNNKDNYPLMNPYALAAGHDVAVTTLVSAKTVIMQGFTGNLTITAFNEGQYTENFTVTLYANTTVIGTQQVSNLGSAGQITLTFTWNTTGSAMGKYTISAYAEPVQGETNVADNTLTAGCIYVSMVGDLTGTTPFVPDGKCDGRDITVVAKCFGSSLGSPNYNPNCDIFNRGKIDGRDITIVAKNFGKQDPTWPPWL
jgi:parallel beta-helix repeat protein